MKPPLDPERMAAQAGEAVAVLKALGHPGRLLVLCQLTQGERAVGELAQALQMGQSTVSQHLALLRREGLVSGRRAAQSVLYRIRDPRVQALMQTLYEQFCATMPEEAEP
ncbi:ArsR/SmtB family transcription factor [Aerosticca soli]|jgi:DNA-binding transcriptional ArsR family regulator|uniref:Transcriptional regulator, ArsR family n=1 Tax=Aerosticca soli TaxID=2010829 RepID=A0A2Z6E8P5_9GAMM|nr:metalloregulator ArsR/SmtB family transcription factor [Aerosticca soli]MDI3262839.1 metalloregulator ArsR/SmtB family transcription factor [Fulvimonas sp.]BBD81222.1 transcriptional regulator, ArsR family [Aerosticca soli]